MLETIHMKFTEFGTRQAKPEFQTYKWSYLNTAFLGLAQQTAKNLAVAYGQLTQDEQ